MCHKHKEYNQKVEKNLLTEAFKLFILLQSAIVIILCMLSIYFFSATNINSFLPVDIVTLFIAVIFLSLILTIVGFASAISNATFSWIFFHIFMISLFFIEVAVSLYASDMTSFTKTALNIWSNNEEEERIELQSELSCCGLLNFSVPTDENQCPKNAKSGCLEKLENILETLRNIATVSMFVCLVLGIFVDFVGCAICYNPDTVTLADEEHEMDQISAQLLELQNLENPFAA